MSRWLVEDWPEGVWPNHACFKKDLETTLRTELGEVFFRKILDECRSEFGFTKDRQAIKCPAVIQRLIEEARQVNKVSATIENIVDRIVELRAP